MKNNPFKKFSEGQLCNMAYEISSNDVFEEDHPLRKTCEEFYGNFSILNLTSLAVFLAQELADRVREKVGLETPLSIEEREKILNPLYYFQYEDDVLMNDMGDDFYGMPENEKYNFSTLKGIFDYHYDQGKKEGEEEYRKKLKNLIDGVY